MGIRPFYDGQGALGSGAFLAEVVEQQAQKQEGQGHQEEDQAHGLPLCQRQDRIKKDLNTVDISIPPPLRRHLYRGIHINQKERRQEGTGGQEDLCQQAAEWAFLHHSADLSRTGRTM